MYTLNLYNCINQCNPKEFNNKKNFSHRNRSSGKHNPLTIPTDFKALLYVQDKTTWTMTCHWLHYIPSNWPLKSPKILFLPLSHSICPPPTTRLSLTALIGDYYMNYKNKAYYISTSLLLLAMKTAKKGFLKSWYQVYRS